MKKLISILGLSLSLGLNAFSQDTLKDMSLRRIENTRTFGKCYFPEWVIGFGKTGNNEEYTFANYNFDRDTIPDLMAFFNPNKKPERDCLPYKTEDCATTVFVDENGDGKWDFVYTDLDGDGILENKDKFYNESEKMDLFWFYPSEENSKEVEDLPYRS